MIDPKMITTAVELPGYRVIRNFGIVRGIDVRSRSIVGTIGASLQTLLGGNITLYTDLCERACAIAHQLMINHRPNSAPTRSSVCATMPTKSR